MSGKRESCGYHLICRVRCVSLMLWIYSMTLVSSMSRKLTCMNLEELGSAFSMLLPCLLSFHLCGTDVWIRGWFQRLGNLRKWQHWENLHQPSQQSAATQGAGQARVKPEGCVASPVPLPRSPDDVQRFCELILRSDLRNPWNTNTVLLRRKVICITGKCHSD